MSHGLMWLVHICMHWLWYSEKLQMLYLRENSQSRVAALDSVLLCRPNTSVMLRLLVLGLVLACAVSLSSSAVILENGAPILWAQTASQVTELPMHDGILVPDPWNYLHRMSLYRLMIAATDPFMGSMGTNATDSPLWGLPLQLGWILTSGEVKVSFLFFFKSIIILSSQFNKLRSTKLNKEPPNATNKETRPQLMICCFYRASRWSNGCNNLWPGSRAFVHFYPELVGL